MSIRVMTLVFAGSETDHGTRLVMLAIADNADDEGTAYPSVARIAHKARLSERAAQDAIRKAESMGELSIETGAGPHGCNIYRINCRKLWELGCKNPFQAGGAISAPVQKHVKTVTKTAPEPSIEPSSSSSALVKGSKSTPWDALPTELDTPEFRAAWISYEAHRKERKDKPLTAKGVTLKWRQMVKWGGALHGITSIELCQSNGHTGLFPPKPSELPNYEKRPSTYSGPPSDRNAGTANAGKADQFAGIGRVPDGAEIQRRV